MPQNTRQPTSLGCGVAVSVLGAAFDSSRTDVPPQTERNGRKTLTTVQGLPKKFDQKKILKVIKKKFGMQLAP
jgi:translation initiation factor SUI1